MALELETLTEADVAKEDVPNKLPVYPLRDCTDPVKVRLPLILISYALVPVNASIDCDICAASIVDESDIPVFDNVNAIVCLIYYKYTRIYNPTRFSRPDLRCTCGLGISLRSSILKLNSASKSVSNKKLVVL